MTYSITPKVLSELTTKLGGQPNTVRTDNDSLNYYGRDWCKHFDIKPSAAVFPSTTEEVAEIVRWARVHRIGIVPSGGRTGLSGGACATNGEIVVSLEKMNRILEFNKIDRVIRCQPGVITEALQNYAKSEGFFFPVDFAARGSSQIGGNVSTNAGGIKVLRYGNIREWIAGLKVVTGTGDILDLNQGLIKNATGYDFRHLFIGSEGTLGIVTEVEVRVTTPPRGLTTLLLGVESWDSIMEIYQLLRSELPITAFEYFSDLAMSLVMDSTGLTQPLSSRTPHYLVVEVENTNAAIENEILTVFEKVLENNWATDGAIAQSEVQARDFWRFREDVSESTAKYTPYKNDISVIISKTPEFLVQVDNLLKKSYPDFKVVWFGHVGDGNMHINILKPDSLSKDEFLKKCYGVNDILFKVIRDMGGSISAEHGVGLVKKPYLGFSRSNREIEFMKAIKRVFDPDGIMNPGKMFDS